MMVVPASSARAVTEKTKMSSMAAAVSRRSGIIWRFMQAPCQSGQIAPARVAEDGRGVGGAKKPAPGGGWLGVEASASFRSWVAWPRRPARRLGAACGRRRVYIVPTRYGYGYGLLLFVMLLGAMNYSNSMAFALTFLLAGIGLLAMHYTHGNLVNLSIAAQGSEPAFAGDTAQFSIRLDNPSRSPRHALTIAWQDQAPLAYADVSADSSATLSLALASTKRGATEFPLGLFHAWAWVELDLACLIYPKPAAEGTAPQTSGHGDDGRWATQRP
eukprot:gene15667-20752_t